MQSSLRVRRRPESVSVAVHFNEMIEQHAGEAQEEAWDAITRAAADAGGGSKPLSFSNVVLLASATA
jgi:hypothetical protein